MFLLWVSLFAPNLSPCLWILDRTTEGRYVGNWQSLLNLKTPAVVSIMSLNLTAGGLHNDEQMFEYQG